MTSCNSTQATALLQHNYRNMAPHYFDPNTSGSNGFSHNLTCDNFMMNWIVEDKKRQIFQFLYVVTSATPSLWTSLPTGESGNNSFFFCISLNKNKTPKCSGGLAHLFWVKACLKKGDISFKRAPPLEVRFTDMVLDTTHFFFFFCCDLLIFCTLCTVSIKLVPNIHFPQVAFVQPKFPVFFCTKKYWCTLMLSGRLIYSGEVRLELRFDESEVMCKAVRRYFE